MGLAFADVVEHSPFNGGAFRWRMHTRALDESLWLQPDGDRDADLALKRGFIESDPSGCLGWLDGSEAASTELLELVLAECRRRGLDPASSGTHPIDRAGRSTQEDLCLLEPVDGEWTLTAGSVCFPTRWALSDKLGASLAEIHGPVPSYAEHVGAAVERFFDRLTPGAVAYRLNWSLVGDGARRLPADARQAPATMPADPAAGLFVRIERQTVRRLVAHRAVVFGIRIHVWPLGTVMDDMRAMSFADHLAGLPLDVARYKNLDGLRDDLDRWLRGGGEGA
ncbi:MAG: DUF3445 domain-containing protein [Actinomycetota bacterium]